MDKRIKYWDNNYVNYWKDRVSEYSQNKLAQKDVLPPDVKIFKKYYGKTLKYLNQEATQILDVGIGFGRFVPLYRKRFASNISGSDISQGMVNECQKLHPEITGQVIVAPAENQPFKNNSVDLIICWATFDATHQEKALREFQRLLKIGGVALITGKNDDYYISDKKAMIAEINARKKGHPNFFTDVKNLIPHLNELGFKLLNIYCYKRRGDASKDLYFEGLKNKFYEYILIVQKNKNMKKRKLSFTVGDKFSQTFKNRNV